MNVDSSLPNTLTRTFPTKSERTNRPGQVIADAVGCTTQNADYRFRQPRDAGRVESKKVGWSLV